MPRNRNLLDALRVVAFWLLVVSVFLGPVGLGASAFASAAKTCGVSCPCDEAAQDGHTDDHDEHAAAEPSDHDSDPCRDECPDDCPNCGCCLGNVLAVLPLPCLTSSAVACQSARMLAPIDAPASGSGSGVYRPPRSLT